MLFNSIEYIFLFLPAVFIIYFLLNRFMLYKIASLFLLAASIFFYGSYKWDYVYIITCSILFNYLISSIFKKEISDKVKKSVLIFGIAGNIIILLFFKYFNSIIELIGNLNGINYIDTYKIIMPLGISFFTLQQISYIVDCYRNKVKEYNLLDYALFICFFPQLVAGPIVRHGEMIPQFKDINKRKIIQENVFIGISLITVGLLKKTIFADSFVGLINYVSEFNQFDNFYLTWTFGILKVLQGYFDFSGYCDMAMGSAYLFNISLPWNFNSPFKAQSIIEFWKRFNMTLIRFLKKYIFRPLNEKNTSEIKSYINILIMFLVMGIWISTSFSGILYGIITGIFVCINKFWNKFNIKINKILAIALTFVSVVLSTQFVFTKNLNQVYAITKSMFGINADFALPYIDGANLIFPLNPPHNAQFNIYIFAVSIIIIFFSKNSVQLAKMYSKADNLFYTIILVIVFVLATLSITKSSDFVYFI